MTAQTIDSAIRRETSGMARNIDAKRDQSDLDELRHLRGIIKERDIEIARLKAHVERLEER